MVTSKYCLYLAYLMFPFYLFPSGGFQIAHIALLLMAIAFTFSKSAIIEVTPPIVSFIQLAAYMLIVNIAWFLITQDTSYVKFILISSFTTFTFLATTFVARNLVDESVRVFIYVIGAAIASQLILLALGLGRPSYRTILYFNNPNQLGYFATISAGSALILSYLYNVKGWIVPATIIGATVLSLFSLSKGGIASCLIYCLLVLFFSNSLSLIKRTILLITCITTLIAISGSVLNSEFYEKLDRRMNGFERANDDSLEGRGYGRIVEFPEYLVFGAGEGGYHRFPGKKLMEIHSYPASMFFCYGIIGFVLLVRFWVLAIPSLAIALMFAPMMIYNLTHNGSRSIVLWILFGLVAAKYDCMQKNNKAKFSKFKESDALELSNQAKSTYLKQA